MNDEYQTTTEVIKHTLIGEDSGVEDDVEDIVDDIVDEESNESNKSQGKEKATKQTVDLPPIPSFVPLRNTNPTLPAQIRLPDHLAAETLQIVDVFRLFFSDEILNTIVVNTKQYADKKQAGISGREWTDLTIPELSTFLGLCIYSGICRSSGGLPWLWNTDNLRPSHPIVKHMSLKRFEQIKRFLHISPNGESNGQYYAKVEPLLSHIRETSKAIYQPSSNVSLDEMMIRFSGKSSHTVRLRGKPTPEGFKILALCDYGYTFTFLPTSRISSNIELPKISGLSETARSVIYLASQLPYQQQAFTIYMDNYFSSIPLFQYLRDKGIGACGTVRASSSRFPSRLKVPKNIKLNWNTRSGVVVDGVLSILWVDNGPVTLLTTAHEFNGDDWDVERDRRRPRVTSINKAIVQDIWGDSVRKVLKIPKAIDDYNHYMGGVDIADQRRSYYSTQLTSQRTWMPLFFWLLDTAIVNSYIIYKTTKEISHIDFRLQLAWALVKPRESKKRLISNSDEPEPSPKKPRVTKNSIDLNNLRLARADHLPVFRDHRSACVWCRAQAKEGIITINKNHPPQSCVVCRACNAVLCCQRERNCFTAYHQNKSL